MQTDWFIEYCNDIDDFEAFAVTKSDINELFDIAARRFLSLFWGEVKIRFPDINSLSVETDYHYNDEYYDLELDYRINDLRVWFSNYPKVTWYMDDNSKYEEKEAPTEVIEFMEFWIAHKDWFNDFYGDNYQFSIINNAVHTERLMLDKLNAQYTKD